MDLKNACDDALREFLEQKSGYRQSHKHTDIRLALGYIGCIFAAAGSYYGYIHPFEEPKTKLYTFISVALYYLFNVLMWAYSYFFEKNAVFTGSKTTSNASHSIVASSSVKSFIPFYDLDLSVSITPNSTSASSSKAKAKVANQTFSTSFGSWFDEDGVLVREIFEEDLRRFIANTEATHME
ncbi:Signal peptidase complex subunit 2 [Actinomortierella ambigua]|nr:Signal peptidase complex subunit 2 [Actinomortierella ambigua]